MEKNKIVDYVDPKSAQLFFSSSSYSNDEKELEYKNN